MRVSFTGNDTLKLLHTVVAVLFMLVFIATGQYMRHSFPEAHQGNDTMRMLFRSAHIYILLSALINGAISINYIALPGWRGRLQFVASLAIAIAPVVLLLAFLVEPRPDRLDRPFALAGIVLALSGVLAAGLANFRAGAITRRDD